VIASIVALCPIEARAGYEIVTEAVNNYGGPGNIKNAIANCAGFRTTVETMSGWSTYQAYTDGNVWDSDFVDPDLAHTPTGGGDTNNFDPINNSTSMSYFCGHGTCDDGFPGGCIGGGSLQTCYHSSACPASANPWGTGAGVCRYSPGSSPGSPPYQGACAYPTDRYIVVNGNTAPFGDWVDYSSGNFIGWGESANSGSWRGAAENGGTNLVVLDLSNGMEPGFPFPNLYYAFAGVHIIATLMPTGGDTAMVPDRGAAFASLFVADSTNGVANSWNVAMYSMPSEGGPCGPNGGYDGFNGCGCNFSMAIGNSDFNASENLNQMWLDLPDDRFDVQGGGWYYYTYSCNYDTGTYPIILQ
jgi:hypothetical protein